MLCSSRSIQLDISANQQSAFLLRPARRDEPIRELTPSEDTTDQSECRKFTWYEDLPRRPISALLILRYERPFFPFHVAEFQIRERAGSLRGLATTHLHSEKSGVEGTDFLGEASERAVFFHYEGAQPAFYHAETTFNQSEN